MILEHLKAVVSSDNWSNRFHGSSPADVALPWPARNPYAAVCRACSWSTTQWISEYAGATDDSDDSDVYFEVWKTSKLPSGSFPTARLRLRANCRSCGRCLVASLPHCLPSQSLTPWATAVWGRQFGIGCHGPRGKFVNGCKWGMNHERLCAIHHLHFCAMSLFLVNR